MKLPARLFAGALAAALIALTGCQTGATESEGATPETRTSADPDAFPVTIKHAFGETPIDAEPKRVATLGWTDQDNALALGVVPVAATKITWGGNAAGSSDWFDAEIEKLGAKAPVRYDDTDGVPVEEVAKADPDLILAVNSGLTKADYDKLTKIAPVVAYPEAPWVTPWRTSLETIGKALGRSRAADEVEKQMDAKIEAARKEYAQLQGKSFIYGYLTPTDLSQVGIYAGADPRVSILRDFGLTDAPAVSKYVKKGEFYGQVSAERAAELDSDVFITWVEKAADADKIRKDTMLGSIPAIADGHFYALSDKQVASASTNPTPLSIDTIIDQVLPQLAKAVSGS